MDLSKLKDEQVQKMENLLNIASDFTRLKIMLTLLGKEMSVKEIQNAISCSQSLVSHQLNVLKKAKLVKSRSAGTSRFYSLDDDHIEKLLSLVYEHISEGKK